MTEDTTIFDPTAGYVVTASQQWPNFNEKVFELFYQPVLGPVSFAMFHALRTKLTPQPLISNRRLQSDLLTQLNAGRGAADEALKRLEAIGMLRTFHQVDQLGSLFVYELQATVTPTEFINDNLLSVLLLETVGEVRFKMLSDYAQRYSLKQEMDEIKEVTHNFLDIFHLSSQQITKLPTEIHQAQARLTQNQSPLPTKKIVSTDFDWPTLVQLLKNQPIMEKDLDANRELIEVEHQLYGIDEPTMARLLNQSMELTTNKIRPQRLKQIIAEKYRVDANMVSPEQNRAKDKNQQKNLTTDEQQLIETCKYYAPVTFLQQLKQQMGGFVTSGERAILRSFVQEQQLDPGVINILSWYVIASLGKATLQANYVNAIANNWMRAGISTAEEALTHIQQFNAQKTRKHVKHTSYRRSQSTIVKEKMPAWTKENGKQTEKSSPEQIDKLRQRLAKRKTTSTERGEGN